MIQILTSLIIAQIDPSGAVQNISLNYGLLGSLFILMLFITIGAVVYIRKSFASQIKDLSTRLDKAETKAEGSQKEFNFYLQDKNAVFVKVIQDYTESSNNTRLIMEKLLLKI